MNQAPPTVDILSGEISAMQGDIKLIADIRAGLPAMRKGSATYLPRYAKEASEEYARRVSLAPWRPEFGNVLLTLASKPFSQPVTLPADTPEPIREFAEEQPPHIRTEPVSRRHGEWCVAALRGISRGPNPEDPRRREGVWAAALLGQHPAIKCSCSLH